MKTAIKILTGALARLILLVLAADLLYLYYAGAWHDPIIFIEITEVVLLYTACVVSVVWTIHYFARQWKNMRNGG